MVTYLSGREQPFEKVGGEWLIAGDAKMPGATNARAERERYCDRSGDELERLGSADSFPDQRLRESTERAITLARRAPAGAECAVFALDSLASGWNLFSSDPGYEDAEDQVERIRDLQDDRDLRDARVLTGPKEKPQRPCCIQLKPDQFATTSVRSVRSSSANSSANA